MLVNDGELTVMRKNGTAYLLWCCSLFGLSGIHRFYLGKPVSGFIYLCTFGLFGIGQLVDLFLIPEIVEDKNLKQQRLLTSAPPAISAPPPPPPPRLDVMILRICRDYGGATLSDCVIETGISPAEIKKIIHQLSVDGLLFVDNRASDGAVIYRTL